MRKINTRNYRLATRSTPREVNRQIVLNLIREHQPISRAELSRRMNVRRAALTGIVRDLIAGGAVTESLAKAAVRGRRPKLLSVPTTGRLAVAVDLRPGRTSLAVADFGGRIISRAVLDTPSSPEALIDRLAVDIPALLATAGVGDEMVCHGIGLVVPGMVDRRSGRVLYAPRLGWRNADLRQALEDRLGLPVHIESAPIACALARLWSFSGETRAVNNFAYVSISDGVGVGIVSRGDVLRGEDHTAGEIGHVSLDPNGPRCACGKRGCWEAFTCNAATIDRYARQESGATWSDAKRPRSAAPDITLEEIIRRAHDGDRTAIETLEQTGREIGRGLAAVVSAFNPKRIYVGGEITAAWSLLEIPMRESLVEGTLTDAAKNTAVFPDTDPAEYRLLGAVTLVASPSFALPRVG
ncbi:MAG TPA: ROK family protein [Gemmatimonadaceae bacterium]